VNKQKNTIPLYGYCQICQGPINDGMLWTLTSNMYRTHYNKDHCVHNLHTKKGMVVNSSTGRQLRIKPKDKLEYVKQDAQTRLDDIRYADASIGVHAFHDDPAGYLYENH
jgi:hypothetical protein